VIFLVHSRSSKRSPAGFFFAGTTGAALPGRPFTTGAALATAEALAATAVVDVDVDVDADADADGCGAAARAEARGAGPAEPIESCRPVIDPITTPTASTTATPPAIKGHRDRDRGISIASFPVLAQPTIVFGIALSVDAGLPVIDVAGSAIEAAAEAGRCLPSDPVVSSTRCARSAESRPPSPAKGASAAARAPTLGQRSSMFR
jgi:hypothetical protein